MIYPQTLARMPLGGLLGQLLKSLGPGRAGQLLITTPRGEHLLLKAEASGPRAHLHLLRPWRFLWRLGRDADLGFARSYIDGDWDSEDLDSLLQWGLDNETALQGPMSLRIGGLYARLRHALARNSRRGSQRNIRYHYDLGNDFYRLWLDKTLTYSSAVFENWQEPLEKAQERKYRRLLDLARTRADDRVLEIGCGWGGMALEAAQKGLRLDGVTLSPAQLEVARQRVAQARAQDRVQLHLRDYRDLEGRYDAIVSVEMFEAVGEAYWPSFFATLKRCLKPGGRAAIQTITIDEAQFAAYRANPEFIQLEVFPGGMLPSAERFAKAAREAGLEMESPAFYGRHYAETLRRWRQGFEARLTEVLEQGMDERFIRFWRYYLSYCERGFEEGRINLMQVALRHAGDTG